jgi:hypothetical protein
MTGYRVLLLDTGCLQEENDLRICVAQPFSNGMKDPDAAAVFGRYARLI